MDFRMTKGFDADVFLRDYWQKKPLLIRNPWADWSNPLSPDELAGLACEDGVEARLVTGERDAWEVVTFEDERQAPTGFARPARAW